jgi:phosphoribosyl-ATP pyrophosphohydrolase
MPMTTFTIHDLERRVHERAQASPDVSYTRKLLDRGVAQCAKKLGEEAVETVIAGVGESEDALKSEAADLLYHLLVLLESRGIAIEDVLAVLEGRAGVSGLKEKADRTKR